jgi:hypothetical protein
MKIIVDVPDMTVCVFVNYVSYTATGMEMGCKSIPTDELEKAKIDEKDGAGE